jgi:alkyl hydroperoxide reductase subunit AhpF
MPLLTEEVTGQLKEEFARLVNPGGWRCSRRPLADPESEQVKRLVEELAAVDPRLSAESYNLVLDKEKVEALGIQRSPAIAILGTEKDYGIRMYGLPSGYEFGTLVEAILDVSSGDSGLSDPTRAALKDIAKPVHIQIFSTPT